MNFNAEFITVGSFDMISFEEGSGTGSWQWQTLHHHFMAKGNNEIAICWQCLDKNNDVVEIVTMTWH